MLKTNEDESTITLLNKGVSKAKKLFDNKISRKEKEDKTKMYKISEKYIVIDTNKEFHSGESVSFKDSTTTGTSMIATADKRKRIPRSNEGIFNAKQLCESEINLKTTLQSQLPQKSYSAYNLPDETTNNFTIEFDCKISKEQTSQYISKDLRDLSFEAFESAYDLPTNNDHDALQKQVSLSYNGNVQSNTLVTKRGYKKESKKTAYRTKSNATKNMNSNEFKKVLNIFKSNDQEVIKNDNARSSEKLVITPNILHNKNSDYNVAVSYTHLTLPTI